MIIYRQKAPAVLLQKLEEQAINLQAKSTLSKAINVFRTCFKDIKVEWRILVAWDCKIFKSFLQIEFESIQTDFNVATDFQKV